MEKEKKILENSSGHGCNDTKTANSGLRFDFFLNKKIVAYFSMRGINVKTNVSPVPK